MSVNEEKLRFILGFKLKNLRLARGLPLREAASRAGISISYLSEIEKGKKYPKSEKLLALAAAYDTTYDDLVTAGTADVEVTLEASLESGFFREFPFELFGLQAEDLFSVLTSSPDRAGAMIRTFLEIGEMYDIGVEQFLFAALRAYQKLHNNYFPDIEQAADEVIQGSPRLERPLDAASLRRFLETEFRIIVDEERLGSHPTLHSFRSITIPGKRPRLFVNPRLLPEQRAFIFAKEVGNRVLDIPPRVTTSSWIKVESFEQVLDNYRTSYFAGALLLGRQETAAGLRAFFSRPQFEPGAMLELMYRLQATPEMFFYRIGQLAYAEFGLKNHYFMRLNMHSGKQAFDVTKLLNLSGMSLPRGLSANEHYCRKWAGMRLLKDRARQREIAAPDLPARSGPTVAAQRGRVVPMHEEAFILAMSRTKQLHPEDDSCVIMGFELDDAFKQAVRFWNDPNIPVEDVGVTCERCPLPLDRCSERIVSASILDRKNRIQEREAALEALETVYRDV
ncbi:MAG: helix-turn-helix domain-containing protein [Bacteroidetes bacterium]|nr:helix-turn-helix domain-containing protein [Bacteroidota bacterium]